MKLIIFLVFILLIGCSVQLRSPIVIKRAPKEEKVSRPDKISPPPHLPPSTESKKAEELLPEAVAINSEQEPSSIPAKPPEGTIVTRSMEMGKEGSVEGAKSILILSAEYLKNTEYKVLDTIKIRDVSQTGFNKAEAQEALQFEAYRRFGSQAKAITNITYGEKSDFIPGTNRFSAVSGEVITWEGEIPPQKKENENSQQ